MNANKIIPYLLLLPLAITTKHLQADDVLKTIEITVETPSKSERRKNKEETFYRPYSKHVIGEKTIREKGIANVAEAVKNIPGVNVTKLGSFSSSIKIRGLRGPRVVTLIDGIKLSNQGMNRSGAGETGMQNIANIKKIEVIKGSPAVIYDPGAAGGVINIITHTAPLKKGLGIQQRLTYNHAFDSRKSTTILDASTGRIGVRLSYSKTDSRDYRIKGTKDKKLAVYRANFLGSMQPAALKVEDLGYNTESLTARISAKIGNDGVIDIDWNNWTGKDMTLMYGATIADAIIIQYDRMDRNSRAISYRKDSLGLLSNLHLKYAKQKQFQAIGTHATGVTLNSQQVNIRSDLILNDLIIKMGAEATIDKAKTLVYSEQNYYAGFVSLEYMFSDWTVFGGVRLNKWQTKQKLLSGTNVSVAQDLIGISGITPPREYSSPTFAIGVQYALNERNNISLNLNTTYRNPNLMERFSFGGILGGGIDMKPEEGKHVEILWKYLAPELAISTGIFYSEFKNFIHRKEMIRIINQPALIACINAGRCNPSVGNFDNREGDFFSSYLKYYNAAEVTNWGIEFDSIYSIPQHEIIFSSSFNQIRSKDKFVHSAAQPVNTNLSYRYEFNNSWSPWVKIKGQYVMDFPKVRQYMGFDPYSLFSLYAGFNKNDFIVSAGIKNLMNTEYRVPFSGINGLARSFFVTVAYEWHSAND